MLQENIVQDIKTIKNIDRQFIVKKLIFKACIDNFLNNTTTFL